MKQKIRRGETICQMASAISFAATLLSSQDAEAQTRLRGFIGLFDRGERVVFGATVSRQFNLPRNWSLDGSIGILSEGRNVEIAEAEVDINTPNLGNVSVTAYAYNSRFYNVDFGAGAAIRLGRFKISAEYEMPNWGGIFTNYRISVGSRITITPQAILLFSPEKAEGFGGWLRVEIDLGNNVNLQIQANQVWNFRGEPLNVNAIVSVGFSP